MPLGIETHHGRYSCNFVTFVKRRGKREVRMEDGLGGLTARWTSLAIHEEVVEREMKV